jgi:hypothetical protein
MIPALRVGAVVVAIGAVAALALGSRVRATASETDVAAPAESDIGIAAA